MSSHTTRAARVLVAALFSLSIPAAAHAQGALAPLNDLGDTLALSQGSGQTPDVVPTMTRAEPPLEATPAATCAAGDKVQPGIDGRVPKGSADGGGLQCNTSLVAHQGTSGGFHVYRYTDVNGHTCAYYDTALLFPLNALKLDSSSIGVAVLDMSDPAHPVQTDTLTELPMMSPHESLNVNQKRGLIGAVLGNPATYPGLVSFYDAHADCRHPVHTFTGLIARLGHESGFSIDGNTFYATGTATKSITAIDVTDPYHPHDVWYGNVLSHGMSLSDDGNRAYVADALGGDMLIMDTSEIQARKPDPQVREISRLTWKSASIPQNAIPFTEGGHPYVLEFDEYTAATAGNGDPDNVGAARIIDIADETQPHVVSDMRLAIDQHDAHHAYQGDPGASSSVQGYAAHYCNIPSRVDPKIVACSFIASGLRLFDISDIAKPKEIGYFVAPTVPRAENLFQASDFAMSQPTFDVARHDVWYTDGTSGFYNVHVADSAWPAAKAACAGRRAFTVHVTAPSAIRRVTATVAGKRVAARRSGRVASAKVDLRALTRSTVNVVVRVTLRSGRTIVSKRTYHPCTRKT